MLPICAAMNESECLVLLVVVAEVMRRLAGLASGKLLLIAPRRDDAKVEREIPLLSWIDGGSANKDSKRFGPSKRNWA